MIAEGSSDDFWHMVAPEGQAAFLSRFCASSGFPETEAAANPVTLLEEIRVAYRDMLRALADHQASLGSYSYNDAAQGGAGQSGISQPIQKPSIPLAQAVEEYIAENRTANSWGATTMDKKTAHLATLVEALGEEKQTRAISDQDAIDVKKIIAAMPKNRQKMPATRGLSLREAIAVPGAAKIDTVTINYYLGTYHTFFEWVVSNKYADQNLFLGIKVASPSRKPGTDRKPFTNEALKIMYRELTGNDMALVKSQSNKWATLIAMFTGARLNEVCQLQLADLKQEGDIWYFNMTDEGEGNKRLKTAASHRKVPVHAELLRLGLIEYRDRIASRNGRRLFPDYAYNEKAGYGRTLGRWFNDVFLVKLGLKAKSFVFHSFRHSMVSQLAQANVQEPIYQCIVGHERKGVTQQVYNQSGFTLVQLKDAIDLFKL